MRVIGVITAKGANIDLVVACPYPDHVDRSKIFIVASLEQRYCERVVKEMNRLVNVFHAVDITEQAGENCAE